MAFNEKSYLVKQKLKGGPKFNIEDFKNVDKIELSYILGFLWADGHLLIDRKYSPVPDYYFGISFNILEKDFKILKKTFNKHMKWKSFRRKNELNDNFQIKSYILDTRLAVLLKSFDYHVKSKVSPEKILNHIPENLHYLFWRGYFDGDGSICARNKGKGHSINISSTYEQDWKSVIKLFESLKIKYSIYHNIRPNGNRCSAIEAYRIDDILIFCNYIYQNRSIDKIGLTRKYKRFLQLKKYKLTIKPKTSQYIGVNKTKENTWQPMVWENHRYTNLPRQKTEILAYQIRQKYIQDKLNSISSNQITV